MKKSILMLVIYLLLLLVMTANVSAVSVIRDLPEEVIEEGAEFQVLINQTDFFVMGTIDEILPQGYIYIDGSAAGVDAANYDPATRKLYLEIDAGTFTITYRVKAGTTSGVFTGTYTTIDGSANPVTGNVVGDNTITIVTGNGDSSTSGSTDTTDLSINNDESIDTTTIDEEGTDVIPDSTSVEITSEVDSSPSTNEGTKSSLPFGIMALLAIIGMAALQRNKKLQ